MLGRGRLPDRADKPTYIALLGLLSLWRPGRFVMGAVTRAIHIAGRITNSDFVLTVFFLKL